eukprot:gene15861-24239_t
MGSLEGDGQAWESQHVAEEQEQNSEDGAFDETGYMPVGGAFGEEEDEEDASEGEREYNGTTASAPERPHRGRRFLAPDQTPPPPSAPRRKLSSSVRNPAATPSTTRDSEPPVEPPSNAASEASKSARRSRTVPLSVVTLHNITLPSREERTALHPKDEPASRRSYDEPRDAKAKVASPRPVSVTVTETPILRFRMKPKETPVSPDANQQQQRPVLRFPAKNSLSDAFEKKQPNRGFNIYASRLQASQQPLANEPPAAGVSNLHGGRETRTPARRKRDMTHFSNKPLRKSQAGTHELPQAPAPLSPGGSSAPPANVKALRAINGEFKEKHDDAAAPQPPVSPAAQRIAHGKHGTLPDGPQGGDQTNEGRTLKDHESKAASPKGPMASAAAAARYRDVKMKKSRRQRERAKIYLNAQFARPVVVNAIHGARLEFAPLRDAANILWSDRGISVEAAKNLVDEKQRVNKYPGMKDLCNKVLFTHHMNRMAGLFPDDFAFYPQTFCLPGDEDDISVLMPSMKKKKKKVDKNRPIWIVKPSKGRQGTGIFLTQDLTEVLGDRKHPDVEYVVQRYIERPLLIDGLKFDLRLYVLVLCVDPLKVYLFDEGLARFATNKYTPMDHHNIRDAYMHLTNYSLNKDSENFVPNTTPDAFDVGSKRNLKSVRTWLAQNGHNADDVWRDIRKVVVNTMLALQASLQLNTEAIMKPGDDPYKCFQILGFDVMLDSDLKPWLLEVNAGPSLETDSPLDAAIKEPLVTYALKECGVIRSFKQLGQDRKPPLRMDDTFSERPPSSFATNKAFDLRKKATDKEKGPGVEKPTDEYTIPDGYETKYSMNTFNLDLPPHLVDKIRTLTQPELELLFLKKLKLKDGQERASGLSFFQFIGIVVDLAVQAYSARDFD